MIDVRLQTLGGPEVAASLANANSGIRAVLRSELADVGTEIVSRAQSLAPKRTGGLAARIIWYFGERRRVLSDIKTSKSGSASGVYRTQNLDIDWKDGHIEFTARPTGSVAHLMERGVNATRAAHFRRVTRKNVTVWTRKGQRTHKELKGKAFIQAHTLNIAPRPFFMPAVESVGGASGVNARLQGALDRVAQGRAA